MKTQKLEISAYAIPGAKKFPVISTFNQVCKLLKKEPDEVIKNRRNRKRIWVEARQITMAAFRHRWNDMPYSQIGGFFGLDHATAMHAVKTISNLRETDKSFKEMTDELFTKTVKDK